MEYGLIDVRKDDKDGFGPCLRAAGRNGKMGPFGIFLALF